MFCWTWWSCGTLGWALQASQYMDGLERQKEMGATAPPGRPAAVWLAVFFKVWFQWLLTLSKCESLLSGDDVLTSSEGLILLMAPYLCSEVWKQGHFFTPNLTPIKSSSLSCGSFSSPAFWWVLPHFGSTVLPPFCISWPAFQLLCLCGPWKAPENHFGHGWAH